MNTRRRLAAGLVTAAFLGGGLALAPATQAASAQTTAAVAAKACYKSASIGWYCGYYKGSAYSDSGDRGNKVKEIQKLINDTAFGKGKPAKIKVDGVFGPATVKHVKWFQKTFVGGKPDGIVGPKTWKALRDK
ncbi:peptidoglycan-binding protein [Streptomyces acidicola]|uniref:peptidoglycan-binding protein n=1 Tax=Streptomyces acidicola TaxID=2596892 RepID=UPI0037B08F37